MAALPPGFSAIPGNDYWALNSKGMPTYVGPGSYYGGVGTVLESGALSSSTMPPASMFPPAPLNPSVPNQPHSQPAPGVPSIPSVPGATAGQPMTQPNYVSPLGNYNLNNQSQNPFSLFDNSSPFVGGGGTTVAAQNQYLSPLGYYGGPAGGTGFYQ